MTLLPSGFLPCSCVSCTHCPLLESHPLAPAEEESWGRSLSGGRKPPSCFPYRQEEEEQPGLEQISICGLHPPHLRLCLSAGEFISRPLLSTCRSLVVKADSCCVPQTKAPPPPNKMRRGEINQSNGGEGGVLPAPRIVSILLSEVRPPPSPPLLPSPCTPP